jgi:hypothetical protein
MSDDNTKPAQPKPSSKRPAKFLAPAGWKNVTDEAIGKTFAVVGAPVGRSKPRIDEDQRK